MLSSAEVANLGGQLDSRWWSTSACAEVHLHLYCKPLFLFRGPARNLQDAPYLLEPLGSSFGSEPVPVRLALLAAAGKLFFARPPECQALLGAVLAAALADTNQDVHDRGLMYYRCAE